MEWNVILTWGHHRLTNTDNYNIVMRCIVHRRKMFLFKLFTQPVFPLQMCAIKVERCSDKAGAGDMQNRWHSPLHRKAICQPMSWILEEPRHVVIHHLVLLLRVSLVLLLCVSFVRLPCVSFVLILKSCHYYVTFGSVVCSVTLSLLPLSVVGSLWESVYLSWDYTEWVDGTGVYTHKIGWTLLHITKVKTFQFRFSRDLCVKLIPQQEARSSKSFQNFLKKNMNDKC